MSAIWNIVNNCNVSKSAKNRLFIIIVTALWGIIGGGLWLLIGKSILPGICWGLCFIGYPAVLGGIFIGVLYLYNNKF